MVRIVDFAERINSDGEKFFALQIEGDLEIVRSTQTGNFYATARRTFITSTFNQSTCEKLLGKEMPGKIEKITCAPFEYKLEETGEIIQLDHKYIFLPDNEQHQEIIPSQIESQIEEMVNPVHAE